MRLFVFILGSLFAISIYSSSHAEPAKEKTAVAAKQHAKHTKHKRKNVTKVEKRASENSYVPYSTSKSYNFSVPGESRYDRSSNGMTDSTTNGITTGMTP